jgi:hypothetical protein
MPKPVDTRSDKPARAARRPAGGGTGTQGGRRTAVIPADADSSDAIPLPAGMKLKVVGGGGTPPGKLSVTNDFGTGQAIVRRRRVGDSGQAKFAYKFVPKDGDGGDDDGAAA